MKKKSFSSAGEETWESCLLKKLTFCEADKTCKPLEDCSKCDNMFRYSAKLERCAPVPPPFVQDFCMAPPKNVAEDGSKVDVNEKEEAGEPPFSCHEFGIGMVRCLSTC